MEVHHPTNPDSHQSGRKKWTHYFREFLMLFLAVFCGFLAEYKLEHILEHQRGKQYASTMVEDLKADKEALESGIQTNRMIITFIDTLLSLYHPDNKQEKTTGQLYYYGYYGLRFWYYVNKQVTLEQMKHSGTIRYFQNSLLENQMVKLDKMISFIKYWDERDGLFNENAIHYSTRLFNYAILQIAPFQAKVLEKAENDPATNKNIIQSRDPFLKSNPRMVNNQPELVLEILNFCAQRIPVLKAKVAVYQDALKEIKELTTELQQEYHLK